MPTLESAKRFPMRDGHPACLIFVIKDGAVRSAYELYCPRQVAEAIDIKLDVDIEYAEK